MPSNVCWLTLGGGLIMQRWQRLRRWGLRLIALSFVMLMVFGFSSLSLFLLQPLENRFALSPAEMAEIETRKGVYRGIIILGGFELGGLSGDRGQLVTTDAAERLIEARRLAERLPGTQVMFTGGAGGVTRRFRSGAEDIKRVLIESGVAADRVVVEGRSLNTWQNAAYLRDIIKPQPGDRFVLITSASHMPRSVGVFRQAGFDVTAWPVDYRTSGDVSVFERVRRLPIGLDQMDHAVKEWIGLVAYRVTGRTNALFPSPADGD